VIIGEDAGYLSNRDGGNTAFGNTDMNSNQLYLEQAYAQFRVPVGNGWDWKVGKFVSILGYEVIERPANMNITYGLLFQNAYTFNYTGVLTSYRFDDYLDAKLGVANGANSDNNTSTGGNGDGVTLLASLNVTAPGGNANWSNNFTYDTSNPNDTAISVANSSWPVTGGAVAPSSPIFVYNSWGNWAPKFADDKLLFAFDSVLGTQAAGPNYPGSTWYGSEAYTKYQFNDWFYLAGRGSYFGTDNLMKYNSQANIAGSGLAGGVGNGAGPSLNWWAFTLTAGFNVIDNLLIRAEYRLDWGDYSYNAAGVTEGQNGLGGGPSHYAGAEVVYSF